MIAKEYIPEVETWMCVLAGGGLIGYGILLAVLDYITAGTYLEKYCHRL